MIAWHGSPVLFDRFDPAKLGVRRMGSEGHGLYLADRYDVAAGYGENCYQVEIPDGPYIDNDQACEEQPEPVKTILMDAVAGWAGPQADYWRFVIKDAPQMTRYYSQVGRTLSFSRKNGTPVEPALMAAGFVGCRKHVKEWNGATEFAVFDPGCLKILSVSSHQRGAA